MFLPDHYFLPPLQKARLETPLILLCGKLPRLQDEPLQLRGDSVAI